MKDLSEIFTPINTGNARNDNKKTITSSNTSVTTNGVVVECDNIPKENLLALFLSYGEIDMVTFNDGVAVVNYINIDHAVKLYNDLHFNYHNIHLQSSSLSSSHVFKFNYNNTNISSYYNDYFLLISTSTTSPFILHNNIHCITSLILSHSSILSIYYNQPSPTQINLIFHFNNSKEKHFIQFMLSQLLNKHNFPQLCCNETPFNLNDYFLLCVFNKNQRCCTEVRASPLPQCNEEESKENKDINGECLPICEGGLKQRRISEKDREKYLIVPENIVNEVDQRTTVMIKNIPRKVSQKFMLKLLERKYAGMFNFFYLPIDFKKNCNVGYAFINFRTCKNIIQFYFDLHEQYWYFDKSKKCYLSYARIQGYKSIAQHFNKSLLLKQIQSNDLKPYLLEE
jgi:hypothetical protein